MLTSRWGEGLAARLTRAAWICGPVLATLIVGLRYHRTWYFSDEWSLIQQIVGANGRLTGYFALFNGHLWVTSHLIYGLQLHWLGSSNHVFVWCCFCLSITLLIYSVGLLLVRLGVAPMAALAAALLVALFGPGGALVSFEVDLSALLAAALVFFGAALVLRDGPTPRAATLVAALLFAAELTDSDIAFIGLFLVGSILAVRWNWRTAITTLTPATVVAVWNLALPTPWTSAPTLAGRVDFGVKLLFESAGGLVHGGPVAGAVVLAASSAVVGLGWRRGVLSPEVKAAFVGGWLAVLLTCASLAWTRSANPITPGIRYLAELAPYWIIGLLPAVWRTVTSLRPTWSAPLRIVAPVALAAVFALNLGQLFQNEVTIETWATSVHQEFRQAVWISERGCRDGQAANPGALAIGTLSPQITMGQIAAYRGEGLFTTVAPASPSPALLARVCGS